MKFTIYTANCTGKPQNSIYPNQVEATPHSVTSAPAISLRVPLRNVATQASA